LCSLRVRTSTREHSELFDHLHSRHRRKLQVRQHDVWAHVDHEFDSVLSGRGLADELESAARQRLRECQADQRLVVDQRDCDRRSTLRGGGDALGWHPSVSGVSPTHGWIRDRRDGRERERSTVASSSIGPLGAPKKA
jgi:hypothetical protein